MPATLGVKRPVGLYPGSIDTFDHLKAEELRQAAVVMAGMLLAAANSDEELPRPPLPT